MAETYWQGKAVAVAQVSTCTVTAFDAATTYILTVGGLTVSAVGVTDTTATAAALVAAWNASTHPYFSYVTAENAAAVITLTADVAGVPFTVASSKSGGTGTIGACSDTTAAAGPNNFSTASNWDLGVVPGDDAIHIEDIDVPICWGLDQTAQQSAEGVATYLYIARSGRIGLDWTSFAISSDATEFIEGIPEYRTTALTLSVANQVVIGTKHSPQTALETDRLIINLDAATTDIYIYNTGLRGADGRAAVRLRTAAATTLLHVTQCPGSVSLAAEKPGETSTIGTIDIGSEAGQGQVITSKGVTITTWKQASGNNILRAAATPTTVLVSGGTLKMEGDFLVTALEVAEGATVIADNSGAANVCATTLTLDGGLVDASRSTRTRVFTTITPTSRGGTLIMHDDYVSWGTLNEPLGLRRLAIT